MSSKALLVLLLSIIFFSITFSKVNAQNAESFPSRYTVLDSGIEKSIEENGILLISNWVYAAGDERQWADIGFNDTGWDSIDPRLSDDYEPPEKFTGIAWFRLWVYVDSTFDDTDLGIILRQNGASELYLDGELLYRYGSPSSEKEKEVQYSSPIPRPLKLTGGFHLFAVRFSNHRYDFYHRYGTPSGFFLQLVSMSDMMESVVSNTRRATRNQYFFSLLAVFMGFLHLVLYLYYRKERLNLLYAGLLLLLGVGIYFNFTASLTTNPPEQITYNLIFLSMIVAATIVGHANMYFVMNNRVPAHFLIFIIIGLLTLLNLFFAILDPKVPIIYFLLLVSFIDIFRLIFAGRKRRKKGESSLPFYGLVFMFIGITYDVLTGYRIIPNFLDLEITYLYGIFGFLISISLSLARDYGLKSHRLEEQLVQVKELSAKAIEHEKRIRDEEIARRIIEKDNQRKTEELNAARKLQLSMLPQDLPDITGYSLGAYMRTATEIGGDYYDYRFLNNNSSVLLTLGDATGHGNKAGILVAIVKGLIKSTAFDDRPLTTVLNELSSILKQMNLGMLYMGLSLFTLQGKKFTFSAAGMPPPLHYSKTDNTIRELLIKGMPLGHVDSFPYRQISGTLTEGDSILFYTDGITELFNEQKEEFGKERLKSLFSENHDLSPDELIERIIKESDKWRGGAAQNDDITLFVLKCAGNK